MSFRVNVDDLSPLVQYSQGYIGWEARNQSASNGNDGTSHYTNWTNSTIALDFSGSAVTVYGKSSRGFRASIDSMLSAINPAPSDTNVLFSAQNLTLGFHTVTISSFGQFEGGDFSFELDSFVVESPVDATGSNLNTTTFLGNSSDVQTFGKSEIVDGALYALGKSSGFAFNFTGSSIALYSPKWTPSTPQGTQYGIYLNSSVPPTDKDVQFANYPSDYSGGNGRGQLRFLANGLPEGEHRVAIVNLLDSGGSFGFEYAEIARPTTYLTHTNICWSNCSSSDSKGPGYKEQRAATSIENKENSASKSGVQMIGIVSSIGLGLLLL